MSAPLLVEFFDALPEDALQGVEDLPADRQGVYGTGDSVPKDDGRARRGGGRRCTCSTRRYARSTTKAR